MAARMICAVQARYLNPILGHTPQRLPTSRLRRAAGWKFGNMFSPLDLRASSTESHVFVAGHVRLSIHHESRLKPRPRPGFRDRPVAACAVLTDHSNDDMRGSEQVKPPAGRELVCSRLQFHWIFGGSLKLSGGGKSGIGISIYFILDGLIMPRSIQ
jgi:hypothetical protein